MPLLRLLHPRFRSTDSSRRRPVGRHLFDLVGISLRAAARASAAATEHEEDVMKVALLGATGFVGSAVLNEALDRGHVVTAIVRQHGEACKNARVSRRRRATFTTRLVLRR